MIGDYILDKTVDVLTTIFTAFGVIMMFVAVSVAFGIILAVWDIWKERRKK